MNINLFALTGFGNVALKVLLENNVKINCLYTRKEKGEFPYYDLEQLDTYAKRKNINVQYVSRKSKWSVLEQADMNLAVTYHRLFKQEHLQKAALNINIHPSLLPKHKGANPFKAVLESTDKECGLSAHYIESEIDSGNVVLQKSFPLNLETEDQLRKYLAEKSSFFIRDLLVILKATKKELIK